MSRILSPPRLSASAGDDHPSRRTIAGRLKQLTLGLGRAALGRPSRHTARAWCALLPCSRWGLPSRRSHLRRWCALTAPFHPYPVRADESARPGGLFSVALSRGSPRVAVSNHRALWSPDFPRRRAGRLVRWSPGRDHPAGSLTWGDFSARGRVSGAGCALRRPSPRHRPFSPGASGIGRPGCTGHRSPRVRRSAPPPPAYLRWAVSLTSVTEVGPSA